MSGGTTKSIVCISVYNQKIIIIQVDRDNEGSSVMRGSKTRGSK
jgi:hypothetical protein